MTTIYPKKSLGQHFLRDENIAGKIVGSLRAEGIDRILEIGPGKGVLTKYLFENFSDKTYLVEIDHAVVDYLKTKFPEYQERIITCDFLKLDLPEYFKSAVALVGNLPYNISSQIFFKVLENRRMVKEVVCMIQKEVADRIKASPGSKTYGILSVLLQAYYEIEYLFTVSPEVFQPPPKVYSAVIRLTRNQLQKLNCNEDLFIKIVKTSFNQRRKMLRNSLMRLTDNLPADEGLLMMRPEQLDVDGFVQLTNLIERGIC